ncbi:aminotransferase class V-fold PLP-dependent enzyme [Candidatus Woesearchaeota archaeon]|nr:aminotransferase class V-fold PLP-dependent enzyme [Candidatus Woesearchaeota archaeon]
MSEVYMDNAATTRLDPAVKAEMDKCFEHYGNPGSFHSAGLRAKRILESAREKAAALLNCNPKSIIFTGSGTESINLAIQGIARADRKKKHIITTRIEHKAILETCEYLEVHEGYDVTYLDVNAQGFVSPEDLKSAIRDNTVLVTIGYANNEIGTVQPIKELASIAREKNILFHTDACQAAPYLDIDVEGLGVDLMTVNGSKLYGPKGIGLLYVREGVRIHPLIHGGGQEFRLRSGTESVPIIAGFVKSLEIARQSRESETARLAGLRDYFISELLRIPKTMLNGPVDNRLPNNINVSFIDIEGEALLLLLDSKGIFASSGSACTSHTLDPSHVVIATGVPYEAAHGSIRFTLGKHTTKEDIDYVLSVLPGFVHKLREISPVNLEMEDIRNANS